MAEEVQLTVKYLSSPKLLRLQLQDAALRRHFLVQVPPPAGPHLHYNASSRPQTHHLQPLNQMALNMITQRGPSEPLPCMRGAPHS